jgi:hypothetical protein
LVSLPGSFVNSPTTLLSGNPSEPGSTFQIPPSVSNSKD